MKKLITLLLVAVVTLVSFNATAQFGKAYTIPLAAGDTVTNSGTAYKIITVTGGYQGAVIQATASKLSGTHGGTIQLFGSNDNTTYKQIGSDYTVTTATTNGQVFYVSGPLPVYLKVLQTGTGTMSSVLTVNYVLRKYLQ